MDWHTLVHHLCDGNVPADLKDSSALELVIGNTLCILELDEDTGTVQTSALLATLPPRRELDAPTALHLLQENLDLHTAGLGTIFYDSFEREVSWKKSWALQTLSTDELPHTLSAIDSLRDQLHTRLRQSGYIPHAEETGDIEDFLRDLATA